MTANEWPYPDNDTSPAVMQQWWDENQAAWRAPPEWPSRELFLAWLEEDYLLDGVLIPEWARAREQRIP